MSRFCCALRLVRFGSLAASLTLGAGLITLGGCGYRTLGTRAQLAAMSICIMPFSENGATGVATDLTTELGHALAAEGFTIEPDAARADSVMTGQIELRHVPGTTLQTVQLYTVDVTITCELWGSGHEPLWQEAISLQEDFLPTDAALDIEPLVTERRRRVAIARLTERAAQELAQAMRVAGAARAAP